MNDENCAAGPTITGIPKLNTEWLDAYNSDAKGIGKLYSEDALLFSEKDTHLAGIRSVKVFYQGMREKVKSLDSINTRYLAQLQENPDMAYETGYLMAGNKECFEYIVIWSRVNGKWLRELEAISEKTASDGVYEDIDKARRKWVKLANTHDSLELVRSTYTENFVYYNRGTVYMGYGDLSKAYDYMNDSAFSIELKTDICTMVKPDLAYDIGKWSNAGYTGSYIIIWEKQINGDWKIRLDTNW